MSSMYRGAHRTGISETVLIPWAKQLWPGAALLAPRGRILDDPVVAPPFASF
jgi:predicted esterase